MRFREISPELMSLPEIRKELLYMTKRLYRLRKLKRMGKEVEPDLSEVEVREADLDLENRKRIIAMEEIPL